MTSATKTMSNVWPDFAPSDEDILLDKIEQDKARQNDTILDEWARTPAGQAKMEALIAWGDEYNRAHPKRYTFEEFKEKMGAHVAELNKKYPRFKK